MIQTTPFEQKDFSGGFTDNIYSDDARKCAFNDNLLVNNNRQAFQRWGSDLFDNDHPQIPDGIARVSKLFKFFDERMLFANNAREAYYFDTEWHYLTGPVTSNPAFGAGDQASHISVSEWQGHLFCVDDADGLPIKIYRDQANAWQVRTAGLPDLALADNFVLATATASLVALANDLRTQMLLHFANTGYAHQPHKVADTVSAGYVGAASTTLATAITLAGELLQAYEYHYKDALSGNTYHQKDLGTQATASSGLLAAVHLPASMVLENTLAPTDIYELADRLNDLHDKYWAHETHVSPHVTDKTNAGVGTNLPTLDRVTTVTRGPTALRNYQPLYDWSTQFKTVFNAHLADGATAVKAHSTAADIVYPITAAVGTTPTTLITFLAQAFTQYEGHDSDVLAAVYHAAVSTRNAPAEEWFSSVADYRGKITYDFSTTIQQIAELAALYNTHVQDWTAHYTTNPTYVANQGPGSGFAVSNYNYAMHYFYEYTVGDVTYQDFGPVYEFAAESQLAVESFPISLANIPVLANTGSTNYDTANITIKIYRTQDAGNEYRLVGSVANGTTTFTDNMPDEVLATQPRIYTTGGVVSNSPPPVARCIHIVGSTAYYGDVTDSGERLYNRIRQSIAGDPDSCPGDFFDDMDDRVIGISSVLTTPVAFCATCIFRLDGQFDELGRGGIRHISIENPGSIGLVSEQSLVRIDAGILFAGTDGFYFTDGYSLRKLSNDWNTTYATLVSTEARAKRITGTLDPVSRRVFWGVQRSDDATDNDTIVCLDLNFPLEAPCWSSWSNESHFAPTSLLMWDGSLLRGDSRGYLFLHSPELLTDPYVNVDVTPSSWGTKAVIIDYISIASNFGSGAVRKWAGHMQAQFKDADLFMAVSSINDEGEEKALAPIRRRKTAAWGDLTISWGEPDLLWDFTGNVTRKRRFPAKSLRFTNKQIRFTSDYVLLKESSTIPGAATVVATAESVTLDDATYTWLPDCEGYFISFESDDYATEYEIRERNSDTLIYINDPDADLTDGSQAWKIYGKPKNQFVHFVQASIFAAILSPSQSDYRQEASS